MDRNSYENLVHHLFFEASRSEFELLSDKQLLQRYISQHDERAIGEVVRRHGVFVWTTCRRMMRRSRDAKDVYQATFLKLVRQATFVQRYESVAGWLHTAVRSTAIYVQRMLDRQRVREKRRAMMFEDGYTNPQDTEDLGDILDKEVGYLPEKLRCPIILCYLEGLTYEQAALRIKVSTSCLKQRLAEGRKRLHQRLSKRGIHVDSSMLVAGLNAALPTKQMPPGLMEKTLDLVRIVTQSNNVMEPAGMSTGVMPLTKKVFKPRTFKARFLLAMILATLLVAGGGIITYSAWWNFFGEQPQEQIFRPAK